MRGKVVALWPQHPAMRDRLARTLVEHDCDFAEKAGRQCGAVITPADKRQWPLHQAALKLGMRSWLPGRDDGPGGGSAA